MYEFQLPEYLEDEATPQTETEKLLERIEAIEAILLEGNTWRYISGGAVVIGGVGGFAASFALFPVVVTLLLSGGVSAAASYFSYCLWEGKELGIVPTYLPVESGKMEEIKANLPKAQKAHFKAIERFGIDAVNQLESNGQLREVIHHIASIKARSTETVVEDVERAWAALHQHFVAPLKTALPQAPTRKAIAPRQTVEDTPSYVPLRASSLPVEDVDDDVWGLPSKSPNSVVEFAEDEDDDDWSILQSVKKSNQGQVATENIALEIAQNTKSHFCFVAEPQTGKSSLLISTIESIKGDIYFVDCKGDDLRFRNLKKVNSKTRYLKVNEEKTLAIFFKLLEAITLTMIERQSNLDRSPITFVIDEINILINIINSYEAESGVKNVFNKFKGKMMRLLAQGLSSGIRIIFTTHTTKVVELFGTSSALQSVSLIGLGKKDKTNAIYDCIDYKLRPKHRDSISEKVEIALSENPESVMALLCYASPPKIVNIPFVDYSHLLQGITVKSTQPKTIVFPTFEDDEQLPNQTPEPQLPNFTPNDLLTWLEKKGEGHYTPRTISANTKIPVADIESAANGLHQAGVITLNNWGNSKGREIIYFKESQEPKYPNNVLAFPMGV